MEIILISSQHTTPLSSFPEASFHPRSPGRTQSKQPPEKREFGMIVRIDVNREGEQSQTNRWLQTRNATLGFLKFGKTSSPTAAPLGIRSMRGNSFFSNVMTKANAARAEKKSLCTDAIGITGYRNDQSHRPACRNRSWPAGHLPRR